MLGLPENGIAHSVNAHNLDLDIFCDWIEASAVFEDDVLSKTDVVDTLLEHEIYDDQDFAREVVDDAWCVLQDRFRYLGSPLGLRVQGNRISRVDEWTAFPAYGFCLLLAASAVYPSWAAAWPDAHSVRGELFEEVTKESLAGSMQGWTVKRIGWSPTNPVRLKDSMPDILADLREVQGAEYDLHVNAHTKEMGLDLLAFHSFEDVHASIPVLLVQCASGKDWVNKRQSPDIELWKKIISFNSRPVRALAMPFAFADPRTFRKQTALRRVSR